MSSGATRRRCLPHHPDRCRACGHGHRGQRREGNWLTCRRCGFVRKARTPEETTP